MVVYNHWDVQQCYVCGDRYEPLPDEPDQQIQSSTLLHELSEFWRCLGCDLSKRMYLPLSNGLTC